MNKDKQYLSVVNGNDFTLNLHVTRWNADNAAYSPYDMTACSQVCCFLVAVTGGRRYKLPVTVDGNVLTADIDGSMLNVGVYGLELLFEDAESHSKRSYEPALLKIARSNAEATYTQADFDSEDDCRLHMTIQANASFITIGSPTADAQIDATSYNAVSNAAVSNAITNLQLQIDTIGSEILDPASVYTKDETEALIDTMVDPQEMADYVTNAVSNYTTTEEFENANEAISGSLNDLNTRITAIEENPVDLTAYVSKEELNAAAYLQSDDLNGYATQVYVTEQIANIPQADMSAYVSKSELNAASYLQADDISDVVRDSDLANAGYITANDVSSMGYVTTNDLSNAGYVTTTELSSAGYVTTNDLSSAGYITANDVAQMGYVTETNLNTVLSSYAKVSDIEDNERVVSTALNSLADRIESVENDYVSDTELDEALLPYATEAFVVEKIDELAPSDLTEYVSKQFLSQQAYLQADDISDVVRDSDLASAGYVTTTELSSAGYVTTTDLTSAGYVTNTDLTSAGYVTTTDLTSAGYVTNTDLTSAGYVTNTDLSSAGYVTTTDLSSAGYVTTTDLSSAGYVTTTELSNAGYITETDLSSAGYVTNTDLSIAGYVTTTELSSAGYVTENELTDTLSSYAKVSDIEDNERVVSTALNSLADRIGLVENDYVSDDELADYATKNYVDNKIDELSPSDLNEYVSKQFLSQQAYLQADDISDVVRDSDLASAGYVTANDLSSAGYVTTTDLSSAGYVTNTDLTSAGYVTETELSSAGYVTNTDLTNAGYVTNTDLSSAGYVTATDLSSAGYVTETELSSAGYVTNTDLSSAGYVTNTDLANAGYATKADVPYKFVVMSYADYTALATKDPNTFYCIPEE